MQPKILKFRHHLVKEILEGRKTATWRLFDDKNLSVGDKLQLVDWSSDAPFAEAEVMKVNEKKLNELEEQDFEGHQKYESTEEMLKHFKEYYGDKVTLDTVVKIIAFKLL